MKALDNVAFGDITVQVTNPAANTIKTQITINPPGTDPQTFLITKSAINWQFQSIDPAYKKIK